MIVKEQAGFVCRNCDSNDYKLVYKDVPDRFYGIKGVFSYVQCLTCGLIQIFMTPAKISDYYADYRLHAKDPAIYHFFRKLFLRGGYYFPKENRGRVLDIGCGNGWYLKELKARGWEGWGYEITKKYADRLAKELDMKVLSEDDLVGRANYFDLITMNFSLEHLNDPRRVLMQVFCALKKGGEIIISLPNIESREAKLFGPKWFHLDPPRHLTFYSKTLLTQTLISLGFSDIIIKDVAIPTGFAGSLSYLVFSKFLSWVWHLNILSGFLFSRVFGDGNFMVSAWKK
jgi:SAM-dependent methyltransferase